MSKRYKNPETFGGRIALKMEQIGCPFCGAKPLEYCHTKSGLKSYSGHHERWFAAKAILEEEGDGPDVKS